jgi:hypothetical protein
MRDVPRPKKDVRPGPTGVDATRQPAPILPENTNQPAPSRPNPGDLSRILEAKRQAAASGRTSEKPEKPVDRPGIPTHSELAHQVEDRGNKAKGTDAPISPQQTPPSQGPKENLPATDKPATRTGPPTPRDVAQQLAMRLESARTQPVGENMPVAQKPETSKGGSNRDVAKEVTGAPQSSPPQDISARGNQQPERTNTSSTGKSSLSRQLERTGLERHDRTREHLDRLGQIEVSTLPEALQEVTKTAQSEFSKAIDHYKNGRIDETSLREMISSIGGSYTMYLRGTHHSDTRQLVGKVAELKHINRLIESDRAVSAIIAGADSNIQYTLEHLETGTVKSINTAPIADTDILYLGRDGKIHIDEIKTTAEALRHTLNTKPEQLQNLATWQGQAPKKREASVVLDRPDSWTTLFEKVNVKQSTSPSASDLLVEHRIPIHVGNTTFTPNDLRILNNQVRYALGNASGARREVLLKKLSRLSPQDVQQGNFKL